MTLRKDLNGMYLLDSALKGKIENAKSADAIPLEITLTDVS